MHELRVLNGMHAGAALPLTGEQWRIGADNEHDLALFDTGIRGLHCRLLRNGSQWSLAAEQGVIHDEEGHLWSAEVLQSDQMFILHGVWLCLAPADSPWASVKVSPPESNKPDEKAPLPGADGAEKPARRFNGKTGFIAGLVISIIGTSWGLSRPSGADPKATTLAAEVSTAEFAVERSKATLVFKRMLSERLLDDLVKVEESSEGLVLSGGLKGELLTTYQRMLQRFKALPGNTIAVIDNVGNVETHMPFTIVQIVTGQRAHVVLKGGQKMFIGDERYGMRLQRIENHRIEFLGDKPYEVSW